MNYERLQHFEIILLGLRGKVTQLSGIGLRIPEGTDYITSK
jgi:hypothetical protein